MNMPDIQSSSKKIDEITLYQANPCPAELLIPYNLSANNSRFMPIILYKTKFISSLFNMDSPLIMTMIIIVSIHLMAAFFFAIVLVITGAPIAGAASPLVLGPLSMLVLAIPVYATLVLCNLKINGGINWQNSLLGPTHIGLTESGFKLWWQGFAFYNYPNLSLWSDIFYIDLKDDKRSGDHILHFIYQSGFGRRTIELPLRGLINVEDARLVLDYFARNVIGDNQSEKFRAQAALGFDGILKEFILASSPLKGLTEQEREEYLKLEQDSLLGSQQSDSDS